MLPNPNHYKPQQCHDHAYMGAGADALHSAANQFKVKHGIKPAGGDKKRVHLLIIDDQYDFSFPEGTLFVGGRSGTGAMDAHQKAVEFIYRNLDVISHITCTLDTHLPFQVFYPTAHLDADTGMPVAPHTIISADDYRHGQYRANPVMAAQLGVPEVWLQKQWIHYCEQLEQSAGKFPLYIWPYHCMIGTPGHRLAGVVDDARLFHSFCRGATNIPETKGGNPLTEHYSIFGPEVRTLHDGKPIPGADTNTTLIETLMKSDMVVIAGEAASHCVRSSIADLLGEIAKQDPDLAKKVYIVRDCTAAVVVPGVVDCTDDAEAAFKNFEAAGMNLVNSVTPISDWPGSVL